ncbi:hypothetical protein EST38_g7151 [Candolleomyces aberdarensis]|uniref:C3H1-type domain-containing protein n=1 Tax=Candolleomyces aberdarensis TaxID=2316362 RepID=A0A4Q2DHZ3_9AGAR|nr:hypothetical protein EST38_g7151 [Candolleomyces aberdarensis]
MSFNKNHNESIRQNPNRQSPRPIIPNPNERAQSVAIGSTQPGPVVIEINHILQGFARGEANYGRTVSRVVRALNFNDDDNNSAKEQALQSYIDQMEQIQRSQRRGRESQSSRTLPSRQSGPGDSESSSDDSSSDEGSESSTPYRPRRSHSVPRPGSRKHNPGGSRDSNGGQGKDGSGERHSRDGSRGRGRKGGRERSWDEGGWSTESRGRSDDDRRPRKRLRESDMPWFGKEAESRRNIDRSCVKSCELLQEYAKDVRQVKRWVSFSATAPPGFPSSEWDNLLKGKAVNLDVVYSSVFHVVAVKENRGRIGDHEISLGHTEPTRKVHTNGDWTIAWNLMVKAACFLFPHRREELDAYGEYIQGEFSARQTEAHWRVIRFDQSVRNEVGGGTKMLLTDFHRFDRHRAAILHTDGLFANPDPRQSNRRVKSNDLCQRFNSENGCPNNVSSCRYRHVCRKCGRGGHGAAACEVKK